MIRVVTRSRETQAYLRRVKTALQSGAHIPYLQRVAYGSLRRLVMATPKKWTGQTRRSWQVFLVPGRGYEVANYYKVMRFLEYGTRDHGPVTAKILYIPLNRKAAMHGWSPQLVRGVDYILRMRVRGITARHIAAAEQRRVAPIAVEEMKAFLRRLL